MLELPDSTPAAADAVPTSEAVEPVDGQLPGASDTPETVAETDEQKNARVLQEQEARSQKRRDAVQRRFDEMTAERRSKDRQIEQLLGVIAGQQQPKPAQATQGTDAEPVRGQDEDYADWVSRRAEWRAEKNAVAKVSALLQERQQREQIGHITRQAEHVRSEFESRMNDFAKSKPDWQTVVAQNEDVDLPGPTIGLLHMDEDGPALMYAIGQNPKLAADLQRAAQADGEGAPVRQSRLLGRIAASLASSTPQVSSAPTPGQPVGSRGGPVSNEPSDRDSPEEWLRKRNAQLRKARG